MVVPKHKKVYKNIEHYAKEKYTILTLLL